ncbi:hypothetical protein Ddye_024174 [Dipteronia dyeriana]|uniref:Reverse transcriptase zinc-binding domain-containing protein n=1 Tax=Dipteronia dyeriana TaxID=168575 RepID=A0AAD9TUY9_9ROSI|nr:hypothetical protein Ddye_024174 [Dipteronia dyeriana]
MKKPIGINIGEDIVIWHFKGNGISTGEDTAIWHIEGNGMFSVKSGYWLGCHMVLSLSTSDNSICKKRLNTLWKLEMPFKVKIFIWKACNNYIPTLSKLESRGMKVKNIYPLCRRDAESTLHVLWECHKLKYARLEWYPKKALAHRIHPNFFEFISSLM